MTFPIFVLIGAEPLEETLRRVEIRKEEDGR